MGCGASSESVPVDAKTVTAEAPTSANKGNNEDDKLQTLLPNATATPKPNAGDAPTSNPAATAAELGKSTPTPNAASSAAAATTTPTPSAAAASAPSSTATASSVTKPAATTPKASASPTNSKAATPAKVTPPATIASPKAATAAKPTAAGAATTTATAATPKTPTAGGAAAAGTPAATTAKPTAKITFNKTAAAKPAATSATVTPAKAATTTTTATKPPAGKADGVLIMSDKLKVDKPTSSTSSSDTSPVGEKADTIHSGIASSTKQGGANATTTSHIAHHSHSSKLDMLSESGPKDVEAERADILSKVLVCRNCEDVNMPLAIICDSCHKDADENPPVFCDACNTDLHQFAKTRQHVRESLASVHTTPLKTELGVTMPPGLPKLESLACSNCDGDPSIWCTPCKTILCQSCARDIHAPKLLREHKRTPLHVKYVVAGFQQSKKGAKEGGATTAADTSASGPKPPAHKASFSVKNVSVVPSPKAGNRNSGGFDSNTASPKNTTTSVQAAKTFMPTSSPPLQTRLLTKVRSKPTDTTDIVPVENAGSPGDVYVFGDPSLGDAVNEEQLEFRNVINPYDSIGAVQVISISCGMDHAGAVTALGSLFMWGSNVEGQLGCGDALGELRHSKEPILIEFERHAPIKQVACGSVHTLALTQDSYVYSWGEGKMGKLGLISDEDRDTPQLVTLGHWGPRIEEEKVDMSGDEVVVSIACGQNNSGCVVKGRKDNYQLYIWGEGQSGQIPPPADSNRELIPKLFPQLVQIHTPENKTDPYPEIVDLSFGTKHVVAVTKSGSVFTWGDNSFGQCGYILASQGEGDHVALQLTPRLVPKLYLEGVVARAVACGERHTTILSSTGDVYSFGSGESHQIGIMDNVDQFMPQRAVGLGPAANNVIKHISVGAAISSATNEAGETYFWGYGVESPIPKLVAGLKGKAGQKCCVGSNANFAFLSGSSAELYEWQFDGTPLDSEETHGVAAGEGGEGEDGGENGADGENVNQHHAVGKGIPSVNVNLRGKRIVNMSSGKAHYAVVTADGKVFGWGSNHLLELGMKLPGDISYVPHPLEIKFKVPIADIKCGVEHSIAMSTTGQAYTWGTGFEGRLGHVSNADVPEPKLIQSLVDAKVTVASIAIGPSNTGIVSTEGHVYLWGAGNGGQIGNDDMLPQFKPVLLKHLLNEKVVKLALGNYHAMALTEKKTIYTWGDNRYGQSGLYPAFQEEHAAYPQEVTAFNILQLQPTHIECGDNICMVLTGTGELYGWGSGETMQLCRKDAPEEGAEPEEDFQAGEDVPSPVRLCFPFQKPGSKLVKIRSFSVRDINCCCVTEDGDVYAWGWDLGEFPSKLTVKQPATGAAASSSSSMLPGATKPMVPVKWDRVVLGHTRMMLLTE